jgi:hypothetical protein
MVVKKKTWFYIFISFLSKDPHKDNYYFKYRSIYKQILFVESSSSFSLKVSKRY